MVKGIGGKTAQRIIVELRDKITVSEGDNTSQNTNIALFTDTSNEILESAVAALNMLGYTAAASQKVIKSIIKEQPGITVETAIKKALRRL